MALDATVGGESADSYIDVATADSLNADRLGPQAARWAAAATADKEKALKQATVDIDARISIGLPWDDDQALRFPRAVDVDDLDAPFILPRIKRATYEQAAYLLSNIELLDDAARRRARGLFSFDEDDLSGTLAVSGQLGLLAPAAEALLAGFIATTAESGASRRVTSMKVHSRYSRPTVASLD